MPTPEQELARPAPAAVKSTGKAACTALTAAGAACKAPPNVDGRCVMHSERYSEAQKTKWRRRGADAARAIHLPKTFIASDMNDPETILAVLNECTDLVRGGSLAVSQANAVAKLVQAALKVGELKLAARVAALEAATPLPPKRRH